jgi:hypothetical protein
MGHGQDRNGDEDKSSSIFDTLLIGLLTLAGVGFAIISGSKLLVASVILIVASVSAVKMGIGPFRLFRHEDKR